MNVPESSQLFCPATGTGKHPIFDAEGKKATLINHPSNPCKTLSGSLCIIVEGRKEGMFDCYQICIQKRSTRQSYLPEKMYLNNAHVQYIHIFVFLSGINQSEGERS